MMIHGSSFRWNGMGGSERAYDARCADCEWGFGGVGSSYAARACAEHTRVMRLEGLGDAEAWRRSAFARVGA